MKAIGSNVMNWEIGDDRNARTRIVAVPRPSADLAALFAGAYASFAAACTAVAEPGLAVVAVSERTGPLARVSPPAASGGPPRPPRVGGQERVGAQGSPVANHAASHAGSVVRRGGGWTAEHPRAVARLARVLPREEPRSWP